MLNYFRDEFVSFDLFTIFSSVDAPQFSLFANYLAECDDHRYFLAEFLYNLRSLERSNGSRFVLRFLRSHCPEGSFEKAEEDIGVFASFGGMVVQALGSAALEENSCYSFGKLFRKLSESLRREVNKYAQNS